MLYNDESLNTPFKQGLTGSTLGTVISHSNGSGTYVGQFAFPSGTRYPFFRCKDSSRWYQWEQLVLKSDLVITHSSLISTGPGITSVTIPHENAGDSAFNRFITVLRGNNAATEIITADICHVNCTSTSTEVILRNSGNVTRDIVINLLIIKN